MPETDIRLLIQIIASGVSLIGIFLGFVFTRKENRRARYIDKITTQTINNMLFLRENSASFLMLTRPEIIKAFDRKKDYKCQLMQAAVNIESIMKYRFDREKNTIDLVRKLTKLCFYYYDNPTEKNYCVKIRELNNSFYLLMSLYDYSDWQYVKKQARTSPFKEFPDFDIIYDAQKIEFDKHEQPENW